MKRFIFALVGIYLGLAAAVVACEAAVPCALGDRSYHVLPPDDWDGQSALPVLLHFHGWARQGDLIVRHERIAGATRKRGVLLVAPNGRRKSWDFWTDDTADVAFADSVLRDVAARYPIDKTRIYVSGYSFGSAMAWRFVCASGDDIAALLAIAGTLPQSTTCPETPREVRHVHGLDDTVMDFPFGPDGDTDYPVALWRGRLGCSTEPASAPENWSAKPWLTLTRRVWDCPAGAVHLDTHPGGHFIPHGWIARQLDEIFELPFSYP